MSAPVDVLALLDAYIAHGIPQERPELQKARAAVAELIEVAVSALYDMREVRDRCTSLVAVGLDEQVGETIDRLAAALARIGGAA